MSLANIIINTIKTYIVEVLSFDYIAGGLIGRAALNKATSAGLFFRSLRDMEFLSCNNLLHLQAMLWHIGRKDLHRDMVEFARSCRKLPLHFFSPNEKPGKCIFIYCFTEFPLHIITASNISGLRIPFITT